jgi:23S rRNA (pseudouridine1915-N3)-methyltransferase
MPKIRIILVGDTKPSFLREGELFYLKRLRRYIPTDWVVVKPQKITQRTPKEGVLSAEAHAIEKRLLPENRIVVLEVSGKEYTSETLARHVEQLSWQGRDLSFVIGGPLGISKEILKRAHETLSLSKLTLTHEMSRLVLLEQLYRSFTIIRGEPYHK